MQGQGQRPPVAPHGLCEEHRHELLDVLAAGVQGVDDGHARVVAGPQRPVSGHPRARLCPPACPAWGSISTGTDKAGKGQSRKSAVMHTSPEIHTQVPMSLDASSHIPVHKLMQDTAARVLTFWHLWEPGPDPPREPGCV